MKLRVEIDDLVEEFNFDKKVVFVGSHPKCHIPLDYEGVGEKHLRIIEHQGVMIVQDLDSGFKTKMNGKTLKAGGKVKFQSFFPIEVAGIFIYLEDSESDTESHSENSYNISFDDTQGNMQIPKEAASDEEVLKEVEKQTKGSSEAAKKYRPQLYKGGTPEETEEFKIKDRNVNVNDEKTKLKKKTRKKRPSNSQKRPRQIKQAKYIGDRYNLNSLIIIFCGIIITAGIYYKKNYNKTLGSMKGLVASKTDIKKIKLIEITDPKMKKFSDQYVKFSASPKCISDETLALCSTLDSLFSKVKGEGAVFLDDTLFVGFDFEKIEKEMKEKLEPEVDDLIFFEEIYKSAYVKYAPLEKFKENKHKLTIAEFETRALNLQDILYFLHSSIINEMKLDSKIKKVHFFSFDKFQGELTVKEFFEMPAGIFPLLNERKDIKLKMLRSFWNAYLTDNAYNYISMFGETKYFDFNPALIKHENVANLKANYEKYLEKLRCAQPQTDELCKRIKGHNDTFEGFYYDKKTMYLIINLPRLVGRAEAAFNQPYNFREKSMLSSELKKTGFDTNKINNIITRNQKVEMTSQDKYAFALAHELINSSYTLFLFNNKEVENVIVLGIELHELKSKLKGVYEINMQQIKSMREAKNSVRMGQALRLYWKSGVKVDLAPESIYTKFTSF